MTKKAGTLAVFALSGALALSACGGSDGGAVTGGTDVVVDDSTAEGVVVSVIHLTANERFSEACELIDEEDVSLCETRLTGAHERWSEDEGDEDRPSQLEQALQLATDQVTADSEGRVWDNADPSLTARQSDWHPVEPDGDRWVMTTSEYLGTR